MSCHVQKRPQCNENLGRCKPCPPSSPDPTPCIKTLEIDVSVLSEDIRILRNGEVILDRRLSPGQSYFRRTFPGHQFKMGDEITLDAYTKGSSFTAGTWYAKATYTRGGLDHEITFKDTRSSDPEPTAEEYNNFATFTL